jgi:hypothetical protein
LILLEEKLLEIRQRFYCETKQEYDCSHDVPSSFERIVLAQVPVHEHQGQAYGEHPEHLKYPEDKESERVLSLPVKTVILS